MKDQRTLICPREDDLQGTGSEDSASATLRYLWLQRKEHLWQFQLQELVSFEDKGKEVFQEELEDAKKRDSNGERSGLDGSVGESGNRQDKAQSRDGDTGNSGKYLVQDI